MQQELIEMLEKVVDHVVFCNGYDQRFSSTSYGVKILKEAGELVEKVKNNEPAVPQREPEAYMVYGNYTRQPFRSIESAQSYMGGLLKSDPEGGYHIRPLFYATPAAPSQPVTLTDEPWYGHKFKEVTRGVWHCECGKTVNEGATPCTNGTQSISTMRRDAVNVDATEMHDAGSAAHAGQGKFTRVDGSRSSLRGSGTQDDPFVADNLDDLAAAPTSPSQEPVPGQQPDTFRERNAQFREQNWQIRFDAAVEARRQAQEQLYSERERHNSEIQALRQEISRLLSSQQLRRLDAALTDEFNNRDVLDKMLTQCIAERDQLRAQLSKAVAEEREACALECESRQANGNRTHTHPDECAAAIRARSNT